MWGLNFDARIACSATSIFPPHTWDPLPNPKDTMDIIPHHYNYTEEEYQALAEVLSHNSAFKSLETAVTAKRWLEFVISL